MTPRTRRVLQAILYEVFAIAFVGPVLSVAFDEPACVEPVEDERRGQLNLFG